MPSLLEANGLTKHYGSVIALDGINLNIGKGITGLLGPNGAGKSTAIKLFLGLIKPTAGSAQVLGAQPYESVEIRARLGYMPEHDCLPSLLAASEFLTHMAQVSGLPPAYARVRAADTLRHVGLAEERYRAIGEYSTGMKQRVKLAQALVHDPTMVFLDEPTAGLDPLGREEMLALGAANRAASSVLASCCPRTLWATSRAPAKESWCWTAAEWWRTAQSRSLRARLRPYTSRWTTTGTSF